MNRIAADRGLRHRLHRTARRILDQHHTLHDFHRSVTKKLTHGPKDEIRAAFVRYRVALTAHFELEERVFFPAVHGADANQNRQIRQLIGMHSRMLVELAHLADSIESLPRDEFSRRLADFATILASHERQEETLLTLAVELTWVHRAPAIE